MADFTIDLRTRVIHRTQRVWRLFPGHDYRFIPILLKESVVFLDLPGLELPEGPVLSPLVEDLDARLLASLAVRTWAARYTRHIRQRREGEPPERPPSSPRDYANQALSRNARAEKGMVVGLFGEAQQGDLVVVPDRIPSRRVLIGEFLTGPEVRTAASVPELYGNEVLPARAVRWFEPVAELELPADLSGVLRTPNAFTLLADRFKEPVFDASYGTYLYEGQFAVKLTTGAGDFTSRSSLDLSLLTRLATVAAAWIEDDVTGREIGRLSEVLDIEVPPEREVAFEISIHSPGSITIKATSIAPLLFVALFGFFQAADAQQMPTQNHIHVINSAAPPEDPCAPRIDEAARRALTYMQMQIYKTACEAAKKLAEQPQVRSPGTVEARPSSGPPRRRP